MTLAARIRIHVLKSLNQMSGQPMPDSALRESVRLGFRHESIAESHIDSAIRSLDAERFVTGVPEVVTHELMWTLTAKGQSAVAQLA